MGRCGWSDWHNLRLPLALNLKNPIIAQRAAETSIFAGTKIVEKSNALRAEDQNSIVGRILIIDILLARKHLESVLPKLFHKISLY